ncbi:GNAT family N-acetyltransferase [Rhodococcus qingshengii]|uniref:GNAT family N-acetyltransferase n=1 Tax=Rhodococcus qingshengii TaxID=334542 RepID=UPI0036DF5F84
MSPVTIRPAWPADLAGVAEIFDYYVTSTSVTLETLPPDRKAWGKRYWTLAEQGLPFLVAEVDGRIGGYGYCAPWRKQSSYRYCVEDTIYLAQWATGRGIGGTLLDRMLTECEQRDIREVIAVVTTNSNEPEPTSWHLHRSRGFDVVGQLNRVGFKYANAVDTILMQRSLHRHDPAVDLPVHGK